jgi:hypothetical protein
MALSEKTTDGVEQPFRLLDVRHMPTLVQQQQLRVQCLRRGRG